MFLYLSGGGGRLLSGRLSEGGECLCHRLLCHRPLQLRLRLWAPYHAQTRPPGRKPSHHPRGQQERPGPVQRSRCRRWGSKVIGGSYIHISMYNKFMTGNDWVIPSWQFFLFLYVSFFPEGRACAVVFDCKFIETSASLQHNVAELFEGVVRQIRLRRDGSEAVQLRRSVYKRKESLTQKARRFLDRLVARNNQRMAVKVRSKSCHDLAVLWTNVSTRSVRLDFIWLTEVPSGCDVVGDGLFSESKKQKWSAANRVSGQLCTSLWSLWPTHFPVWPFGLTLFVTFPPDDVRI